MAATAKVLEQMELSPAKRRLLEQRMRGTAQPLPERIAPRPPGARTPISSEQHRVWLHQAMEPELPIYNESITVHRRGSLDLAALEAAFNEVLRRHEALRTSFGMVRGELSQVVAPELRVRLPLVDLTELPEFLREEEACRVATEDAAAPIGLSAAPLFRVKVLRLSATHHWLQLTLHHIIFDGVSIYRTLVPELAALYAAFAAGRPSPLAEPELQYADYALWRERQLESPAMERRLEYWRRELAGELPVLRLPVDRAPSARVSHRGAMESVTFPEELVASLRGLGRAHGVTLYMLLLAGLKTLFFRYSGQEDVIVGGLVDGRRRPELEGVVGYFLDTFAIRTRPSAELRFADYLRSVRHAVLGALAEAEVPFGRVVRAVQPVRDGSHHPIFQTFLAFQPHAEALAEGWEVSKTKVSVGAAKFDLYIEVEERPGNTAARFMYRTDLFDAATVQRMAGHWMTLLAAAAEDPERRLGELPVLTPGERALMLETWNERQRPVPAETLHGLVASRARRTPDAVAVEFEGARWSYAELEGRAELLAGRLRAAGVRRGELVAVCLERSQYLVAGLLAVLKTGAAYLPLDPGTPRARRVLCLEDAASAAVLTQRALADDLPQTQAAVVLLEDALLEDAVPEYAAAEARFAGSEGEGLDDAAYIIHTSGSTGRPKAVEISHRAMVNLLVSMEREPGFTAKDTLLAVTTVSFDIAGLELFLPLIAGGTVVVAPRAVALDPYLLGEAVERSRCTVLQATPATWRALLATGWKGRPGLKVLCGGEAMTRELANGLLGSRPGLGEAGLGMEVWNLYGPTETTIWSTAHRVTLGSGPVSVGRPIANTTAYVFDARRQPVPVGVPGELYLGGMGLANGYRGQPELTAEKFVTVDLGHGPERLYRTGDYALFRADGRIEVQGRADNQVKVRGYRIELEDVESALATHPGVGAGAAKVWPDPSGGNRLSAYLVGKAGAPPPDAAELRAYLKMRVPEYMVPSDVVALEAMPLTANGKMDRKALLAPSVTVEHVASTAPATVTERRLAAIWAELLGVGAVGMEDNFFDLGGHSLLVARLQQRIAAEFGRKLSMAAIFHAPTMARQMALLEGAGGAVDGARLIPIQPVGSKPPLYWVEPTPLIANLGRTLGTDQPLLGVTLTQEDLDTMGDEPGLEAFARRHAETIVKAQPVGPYYVGGLCVGGILAYEVAAQLTAAGHTVASLVLLDAENPVFYRRFDTLAVEAQKLVFYARRALGGKGQEMFWRHLRSRLRRLVSIADRASTEMSAIGSAILAAAFRYRPPAYRGDVLLVVPKDRPRVVNYVEGWRHVVQGRLTCADVDGHHDELLDPGFAAGVSRTMLRHFAGLGANGLDTNGLGANAS